MVDDYVRSCYNYPARGDYNSEALIFQKWPPRDFLVFLQKNRRKIQQQQQQQKQTKTNKKQLEQKKAISLSNYTKTIILLRLSEYYIVE